GADREARGVGAVPAHADPAAHAVDPLSGGRLVANAHARENPIAIIRTRMALLVLFAFVAGAGTAVTPCVLPVLPALLASAGTGGRRRPLGVIVGLAATFTIAIVAL